MPDNLYDDRLDLDADGDDRIHCHTKDCGEWSWDNGDIKLCENCEEYYCPECMKEHQCQ